MIRSILLFSPTVSIVPVHAVLTLELQVYNETCGNGNGLVVAQVSGGVPPYTYDWSTGETTQEISGLIAAEDEMTSTMLDGMEHIELLSTDGRLVHTQRVTGRSITMDISALSNGLYILRARGNGEHVRTTLLTKQ